MADYLLKVGKTFFAVSFTEYQLERPRNHRTATLSSMFLLHLLILQLNFHINVITFHVESTLPAREESNVFIVSPESEG